VVEDEEIVRRIVVRTLRDEGYEVLEAGHGVEALAQLNESDHAIALVLTGVVMPVMSGKELAEHIAREYPHLPLVWMSGYPRDSTTAGRRSDTEWPFLQKPTAAELLVETVRTELARSQMAKSNR
jgi:two-component system cell cycle sensor histidine kinase/response regulator CckA